jgi:iron complex outermembrane recepter protein
MKKMLLGICFLMAVNLLSAQSKTTIKVTDINGAPVPNATIELAQTGSFIANTNGELTVTTRQQGRIRGRVSSVGFKPADVLVELAGSPVTVTLERTSLFLDPVEIKAVRAGEKAPFSKTNLSKSAIEKLNLGQDLPFVLSQTPSVVVTSDAGNGVGYTGLRIRGTDATRINVTIDGIPYNEAESLGTFFVDLPDFVSSVNSIQIQRGVGTSSNGAGAFGASINLSTNEFNEKPYAEINNSVGSFNTWKNTVKVGSGLINNHFMFDARLSRISSDGFIDRSNTDLRSFYLNGAYITDKSSLRVNIFSGKEKTYQAWNGIPQYKLFYNKDSLLQHYYNNQGALYFTQADSLNLFNSDDRKYNVFTYANQTDNYQQDHYHLLFNHRFNNAWSLNTAAFLAVGKGYYEEYKYGAGYSSYGLPDPVIGGTTISETDIVRQLWLDNKLYGGIFSLLHKDTHGQFTLGGGWNQYDGKHYGFIKWAQMGGVPPDYRWYYYTAVKKDFNTFAKYQYKITEHLEALADVQYRRINYNIGGTHKFPGLSVDQQFNFINPKVGLTYTNSALTAYASYAIANKEPNRDDYETGSLINPPKREQLQDIEVGVEKNTFKYTWGVNLYYMNYKDQLVLTGRINDVGDAIRMNVPKSYRLGIELQGRYRINKTLQVSGNLTLSDNKIKDFTYNIPRYDVNFDLVKQEAFYYSKTDLSFAPRVIGSALIEIFPFTNASINLVSKYVDRQYMDNTTDKSKSINSYFVQDLRLQYTLSNKITKEIALVAQLNNVWARKYESNGYTYSYIYDQSLLKENFYFPMAGRNLLVGVNIKF